METEKRGHRKLYLSAAILGAMLAGMLGYTVFQGGGSAVPSNWAQQEGFVPVTAANLAYYTSLNHNNSVVFQGDVTKACSAPSPHSTGGGSAVGVISCAKLTTTIHHQEHYAASIALLQRGFNASCLINCNGITYTQDPQPFVVNQGQDFEQCRLFGVEKVIAYTCSTDTHLATVQGVSTSATALAVTDTYATSTAPCGSTLIASTNGLGIAVSTTVTAGTPSGTSTTQGTTVVTQAITFTDSTGTTSSVQDACLLTSTTATIYLVAEGNIGPDTLAVGNTLTNTWTLTLG